MIGKYNRWTIIQDVGKRNGRTYVLCECDCGTRKELSMTSVKNGYSKSCGCLMKEKNGKRFSEMNHKHGKSKTRLYSIWLNMKQRCFNKKANGYYNYGCRGISVCKEWLNYELFEKWSLDNGYNDNLEIDRIDINKGYEPSNCRFVTKSFNTSHSNKTCRTKSKSRFTKEQVVDMVEKRHLGYTYTKLANEYNTSISHAKRLVDGEVINLI